MPLSIPSRQSVAQSIRAYFLVSVPEWDTSTERRSYIGGMIKSLGSSLHDWYMALKRFADYDAFPQTATGSFLTKGWWVDISKISPNPAAPANGIVVFTGTPGGLIPTGTVLTANNLSYTVDNGVSIVTQSVQAATLTSASGIATFTSINPHNLATGMTVTFAGAVQTEYNVSALILVIDDYTLTYPITGAPASPATRSGPSITATAAYANTSITATTTGPTSNLDDGTTLNVPTLTNVDSSAIVTFSGIVGGTLSENVEAFRQRVLFALGTDFGTFSGPEIQIVAEQVPGVTRVWVRKAMVNPPDGWPLEGQVYLAFMRDLDPDPFPTLVEVNAVKNHIISTIMPAHTAEVDVVVRAPNRLPVNFAFTQIKPDTPSMRSAIQASLAQFFSEGVDYGVGIPQDDYRCAIRDTYDAQTRTRLTSFVLSSPSSDVTSGVYDLPVLGTLTWPT